MERIMPDLPSASLTDCVRTIEAGAQTIASGFLGSTLAFALADGNFLFVDNSGDRRVPVFADATLLVADHNATRFVAGSDQGELASIDRNGSIGRLAHEGGKWIDAIAVRPNGTVAWSAGAMVRAREETGPIRSFVAPSSVRGLAFHPKGYRLAASHYNGVSLWYPNVEGAPEVLNWKGSHLEITISPDGRFIITAMQENALHGWKLPEKKDLRMTGYSAKSRSLSWSPDGHWLATSGAPACVVWPFHGKDGPMGQAPRECGVRPARVSQVAFHPQALVVAVGYEDGWVLLCRLTDGAEILVRAPTMAAASGAITTLAWEANGRRLGIGTRTGQAAVLTLPA
jgi:hypothetical protein